MKVYLGKNTPNHLATVPINSTNVPHPPQLASQPRQKKTATLGCLLWFHFKCTLRCWTCCFALSL